MWVAQWIGDKLPEAGADLLLSATASSVARFKPIPKVIKALISSAKVAINVTFRDNLCGKGRKKPLAVVPKTTTLMRTE